MVERKSRLVSRFTWAAVPAGVVRAVLESVYRSAGDTGSLEALSRRSDEALPDLASNALGSPPRKRHTDDLVDPLREHWLATLDRSALAELVNLVQHGLVGPARDERPRSKADLVTFLRARRRTANFKATLRSEFIARNKLRLPILVTGAPTAERDASRWFVRGAGAVEPNDPYPHQRTAWAALDTMIEGPDESGRGGLIVLPTGSGKTYTVVRWLLERMNRDDGLKVLWIADRLELIEQAALLFESAARSLPAGFERTLRRVHGSASPITTLADESLDIAVVTRHSLCGRFNEGARKRITSFVGDRPTVVVVDEAHHAIAPTYIQILDFLDELCSPLLVGLTATPWPRGYGGTAELRQRFPRTLVTADTGELVRSGILARPIHHSVETGERVELTDGERAQLGKGDLTVDLLQRFNAVRRNDLIVDTWWQNRREWGKTLVFAVDIAHADRLTELFEERGARVLVVHTRSGRSRSDVLDDFRASSGPTVLVSVGMLTEGVDLPDARTAFLARPTTSRILLRQMIGRVLRGERAGGESFAHIVDVRDKWDDDVDVLRPIEIPLGGLGDVHDPRDGGPAHRLPPIPDEQSGEPVPEDVVARVLRACAERHRDRSTSPVVTTSRLVGFYRLVDVSTPVFDHARRRFDELIEAELGGRPRSPSKAMELFEDLPIPRPLRSDVEAVVEFVRSKGHTPPFEPLTVTLDVRAIAADLASKAMLPAEQAAWLRERFDNGLARAAYPGFQAFYEAVHQELFALSEPGRADVENPRRGGGHEPLRPSDDRDLAPILHTVRRHGEGLLADEDPVYLGLLATRLEIQWTSAPAGPALAFWAPRLVGRHRGEPVIWVNPLLRADPAQIPDEVLEYLVWHEVVHHLLPHQGHDAEFRRLEALWPDSAEVDHFLDTLADRFDLSSR